MSIISHLLLSFHVIEIPLAHLDSSDRRINSTGNSESATLGQRRCLQTQSEFPEVVGLIITLRPRIALPP